jgi:predicted DNA-binding protein with PD1-like motif
MRSKVLNEAPERTIALVFETGDDVLPGLVGFAREHNLAAAHFSAIGAFQRATLGYFDWQTKSYLKIPIDEQVEVVSLIGDIALKDGKPQVHAHVVVGRRDGHAYGGHLLAATVRPTLEVIVVQSPSYLARRFDAASGLALIDVGA